MASEFGSRVQARASTIASSPTFGLRRVLLLQGPNGPFFERFSRELRGHGVATFKINFNAGDFAFGPKGEGTFAFRGRPEAFPAFIDAKLTELAIDGIFLFGDGRPHHRTAIEAAKRRGVRVFVLEEGYLRPDWITIEEGGVNGHSPMPRDAEIFRRFSAPPPPPPLHVGLTFRYSGTFAMLYAIATTLGRWYFPHYRHHRSLSVPGETFNWVRGALRKYRYRVTERGIQERLATRHAQQYFLVVLQVYCDYQLEHSSYADVRDFIDEVMRSFAEHAPRDQLLVIKHHPMDRAYRDYTRLIRDSALKLGLGERVLYIHDQHLPTMLTHARGAVMINSTVGLQAALQGTPVKVMGTAVYDMPGITHQGSLAEFWHRPEALDAEVVRGFRAYLLAHNQVNGNFAKRLPGVNTPTGIRWPESSEEHGE